MDAAADSGECEGVAESQTKERSLAVKQSLALSDCDR
jgi:hypothetical protein